MSSKTKCKKCGCPTSKLQLFTSVVDHCECCERGEGCTPKLTTNLLKKEIHKLQKDIIYATGSYYPFKYGHLPIPNLDKNNPDD